MAVFAPPNEGDSIRISNFERQQKQECLDAVKASVDEIAHEEVIRVWDISADFEQFFEVIKLTVNVPADGDGRVDSLHVGLFDEDFPGLGAQGLDFGLFDDFASSELFDLSV